jgi:hypothetical protein
VDHSRVTRSTVDRWRRGQEGVGDSRASSHSRAHELTGGEHDGPVSGLTGAQEAVWWPSDGDEAAMEEKHGGGSAQASGEVEKRGGGRSENGWRPPPFIGAVSE